MDAEEIARLVQDLRVSSDVRNKAVTITGEEAEEGRKRLENVVVGKIFSRRSITREMLRSNLPRILRARGGSEIELVGNNLFVISFTLASDKRVALEEGPWHFFQDLMIIKQARAMETPTEVEFNDITLWVQCHNVPLECMNPSIIRRIGEQVGNVVEVDVDEGGGCVGKFARVKVTRAITAPLVRCVPLKQDGLEKEVFVILQYEKLPDFCFLCGCVGHISRDCRDGSVDKQRPRFDSWLRVGRFVMGRRETAVGFRGGSGSYDSGGSGSRWVALRSGARGDTGGSEKAASGDEGLRGDRVDEGGGEEGLVSEEVEESSAGVTPDVSMQDRTDAELSLGKEKMVSLFSEVETGGGHVVERIEVGDSRGSEGGNKGKGKFPVVPKGTSGLVGPKKWKRLAREQKGELGVRSEIGDVSGVHVRRPRRRETTLRDEEEAEEEGHRTKIMKGMGDVADVDSTAEAATQPRRSS